MQLKARLKAWYQQWKNKPPAKTLWQLEIEHKMDRIHQAFSDLLELNIKNIHDRIDALEKKPRIIVRKSKSKDREKRHNGSGKEASGSIRAD